jgi:hypothetical protein
MGQWQRHCRAATDKDAMIIIYVICLILLLAALGAWLFGGRWNDGKGDE